jgi:hypothetical protein
VDALGNLRFALDRDVLSLSGVIDETAKLADLTPHVLGAQGFQVTIDLGEVTRINSVGVLGWLRFMRQLAGRPVVLRRCPSSVIEQMSMVLGFQAHAKVESVLAPYACARCHNARFELIRANERGVAEGRAPARPCPSCGAPMALDDDEPLRWLGPLRPKT